MTQHKTIDGFEYYEVTPETWQEYLQFQKEVTSRELARRQQRLMTLGTMAGIEPGALIFFIQMYYLVTDPVKDPKRTDVPELYSEVGVQWPETSLRLAPNAMASAITFNKTPRTIRNYAKQLERLGWLRIELSGARNTRKVSYILGERVSNGKGEILQIIYAEQCLEFAELYLSRVAADITGIANANYTLLEPAVLQETFQAWLKENNTWAKDLPKNLPELVADYPKSDLHFHCTNCFRVVPAINQISYAEKICRLSTQEASTGILYEENNFPLSPKTPTTDSYAEKNFRLWENSSSPDSAVHSHSQDVNDSQDLTEEVPPDIPENSVEVEQFGQKKSTPLTIPPIRTLENSQISELIKREKRITPVREPASTPVRLARTYVRAREEPGATAPGFALKTEKKTQIAPRGALRGGDASEDVASLAAKSGAGLKNKSLGTGLSEKEKEKSSAQKEKEASETSQESSAAESSAAAGALYAAKTKPVYENRKGSFRPSRAAFAQAKGYGYPTGYPTSYSPKASAVSPDVEQLRAIWEEEYKARPGASELVIAPWTQKTNEILGALVAKYQNGLEVFSHTIRYALRHWDLISSRSFKGELGSPTMEFVSRMHTKLCMEGQEWAASLKATEALNSFRSANPTRTPPATLLTEFHTANKTLRRLGLLDDTSPAQASSSSTYKIPSRDDAVRKYLEESRAYRNGNGS